MSTPAPAPAPAVLSAASTPPGPADPSDRPDHADLTAGGTGGRPRRVLISGGTSGIGYACAEYLVSRGEHVWVLGFSPGGVKAAREQIALAGASVCDVSVEDDVVNAVHAAREAMGGIDGVFVNAGIDGEGLPAAQLDASHFRRVMDVNVLGAFLVARTALGAPEPPSSIVFNASVNALRPELNFLEYNASKAAVVSMAKSLALEVSGRGVAVTAVCPGYFPTRMTAPYLDDPGISQELRARIPAGRFGDLAEIAALVDFLLSPRAAFMTGSVVSIDGGASI
ncbi:MAG TPA: SDR family oxidoreductase [Acidimicrobiales bacterium]|nr:SDR family oxidoreductase [Acidimicrobiales bacterium]